LLSGSTSCLSGVPSVPMTLATSRRVSAFSRPTVTPLLVRPVIFAAPRIVEFSGTSSN
jgi:hypothetical protein